MGIPVILATAAACGSLVTTVKSGWELSRMIRQKQDQRRAEEVAQRVYRSLRRALHSGLISDTEYDHWFGKFLVAESEKNLADFHKIRAHLRTINEDNERHSHRHGSRSSDKTSRSNLPKQTSLSYDDDKRRKSVRFDMSQTRYVPDPPQRYQDVEWPQTAGSVEYFPLNHRFPAEKGNGPEVVSLARLQRSSSVSYQRHGSSAAANPIGDELKTRDDNRRGRPRRREALPGARPHADASFSNEWYYKKLGHRSRR